MTNKSNGKDLFYKLEVRNTKHFELSDSVGSKLLDSQRIGKEQYHILRTKSSKYREIPLVI